jgi:hypothetical protein
MVSVICDLMASDRKATQALYVKDQHQMVVLTRTGKDRMVGGVHRKEGYAGKFIVALELSKRSYCTAY